MKKVLIAFDGTQFSEGAFHFAQQLNQLQPILLVGLFLPQVSTATMWSFSSTMAGPVYSQLFDEEYSNAVLKNIHHFEDLCKTNGIEHKVYKRFSDFALPELKKETRFADLLILGGEKFYMDYIGGDPIGFIKDILHEAECPVLIIPEKFHFPKRNIIAYDGGESSVFALKQFAYLFPELCNQETVIVFSKDDSSHTLPDEDEIEELAIKHFREVKLLKLNVGPKKYFGEWLKEENSVILVCGSFSRSAVSQFFNKSFVNDLIADHQVPIFIAHR